MSTKMISHSYTNVSPFSSLPKQLPFYIFILKLKFNKEFSLGNLLNKVGQKIMALLVRKISYSILFLNRIIRNLKSKKIHFQFLFN